MCFMLCCVCVLWEMYIEFGNCMIVGLNHRSSAWCDCQSSGVSGLH